MPKQEIIIVDKQDNQIGIGEKIKVHKQGKLHRAFSILIFNSKGETLIQKRAKTKYHSPGLWTNACCSHPRQGKDIKQEARKRLKEEMGIECDNLKQVFSFIYKVNLGGLTEYEFDHVFTGQFNGEPKPNKGEADDWKWISKKDLQTDIEQHPEKYTYWFKIILQKLKNKS